MSDEYEQVLLADVVSVFDNLIGDLGQHGVISGDETYIQPYVYLSLHVVEMRTMGWDVDFDQIAAVSGASALFGYQPGEFMAKYAHTRLSLDERIAEATGFGYEWVEFAGVDEAWQVIVDSIDAGTPLKGWDWENILFGGYEDAALPEDRRVFAMADGPETYARWLTWGEFGEWVKRMGEWKCQRFGRFTGRVEAKPSQEVAPRVMRDLVAWSVAPPESITQNWPEATWGLAGIEALAGEVETSNLDEDWIACHGLNPQWTIRNCTGTYLKRIAEDRVFSEAANAHLIAAADQYRAAFECWQAFYALLGHNASETARKMKARRLAGAAVVRAWLEHETAALAEVGRGLAALGS